MTAEHTLSKRLLVVDDDPGQIEAVRDLLEPEGITVAGAASGEQALTIVATAEPDAVLLDVRLPGMNGLETLRAMRANGYTNPVVLTSGRASLEPSDAVESGAEGFLPKPMDPSVLMALAQRMVSNESGGDTVSLTTMTAATREMRLVGKSPEMLDVSKSIAHVARTDAPVLIVGEPGTGKELVAYVIHQRSRRPGPLMILNCASTPVEELERTLFSLLEQAAMGTLLVKEIASMPLELQDKFLDAIENREFPRNGSDERVHHTARVIVTSQVPLAPLMAAGSFRSDLYYRLGATTIHLSPLRERAHDIRLLTDYFAHRLAARLGRRLTGLSEGVYQRLSEYSWPGNVRELRRVVERSLLMCSGHVLTTADLMGLPTPPNGKSQLQALADYARAGKMLEDVTWDYINQVLSETCGNQSEAARRLGIHRNTLRRMMQNHEARG